MEEEKNLEQMFADLDKITEKLEDPNVSLEDSVKIYTEGIGLLNKCKESLDLTEKQLLKLNEDGSLEEIG